MKKWFVLLLLGSGLVFAEEIGAEDKEILKQLEFFSNLELLEDDVDLEDLDKMELGSEVSINKKEQQ